MKNSSDFIAAKVHQQRRNGCENMSNHSSYHTKFSQFIVHGWFSSFSFEQTNIKICFSFQWIENEKKNSLRVRFLRCLHLRNRDEMRFSLLSISTLLLCRMILQKIICFPRCAKGRWRRKWEEEKIDN